MRKIFQLFFALSLMLLLLPPAVQAQERTISGTIVSEDKTPLPGVTVRVKGTRRIVQTDANGKFSIKVNPGESLQVTHVGYQTYEVKPSGGDVVGVTLKTADNTMGEVVVTALDIKRNVREVSYSVQKVSGKDIAETQRENFLNSLQGRVAGLTINPTSGQAGASSQIVLRGFNSMTGANQPLFVVDGIILDNSTINETSNGGSGIGLASDLPNRNNDYTNRIADLNPADIESVTVLKGPEATALYGSQASSGAIIITTKKAKATDGKLLIGVAYDNSFRMMNVTRSAPLDNQYGPGTNGIPGSSFSATSGSYFGPKYPVGIQRYNNIDNFFRTGFAQAHNLSVDIGTKITAFKVTGSFFDEKAVTPGNDFKKFNVRVTNTTKINKWIDIAPSFQYINQTNNKPLRSAGGYLLGLYAWPVTNDISTFQDIDGNKISIFSADPYSEIDNPLYNTSRNVSYDKTIRKIISGSINLNPFKWLSVAGRFGYDTYDATGYTFYSPLSFLTSSSQNGGYGRLTNYWKKYFGYNHTITATVKKTYKKFTGRLMVGTMWQNYETQMISITGTNLVDSINKVIGSPNYNKLMKNGQVVTDANFAQTVGAKTDSTITRLNTRVRLNRNNFGLPNLSIQNQFAVFGEAAISYNNLFFLSYTHRFEQSSLFPKINRKYDFPGFSASLIVSDLFPKMKGKLINYWKIRASRASTARYPDPYKNQSVFVNNFTSSNVGLIYSYGFDNNNPFLKPERQNTYELGTEIRLFNSKLAFDFAYYNTLCTEQIQNQFRASYATGFILNTQNAASCRNQGVELVTDIVAMRKKNLSWNIRFNFSHMWSKVLTLPEAIAYEAYIADTWLYGNARGGMIRGRAATTITGFHYQRNNTGKVLISPTTGLPIVEGTFLVIGDRMPDFNLGTLNTLRYKNWGLSFLWDLKVGGDVFDATDMYLTLQGKGKRTADRERPRVVDGVLLDGFQNSATPTVNTISIVPYFQQAYYTGMPEEEFIEHDVNYLRLRDITLSYDLPTNFINKLRVFKSLGLFVTGTDLVLLTNYRGADPSVNGNTAGSNGVGGMGIDYGSLPAPTAVNFGLKAIFK